MPVKKITHRIEIAGIRGISQSGKDLILKIRILKPEILRQKRRIGWLSKTESWLAARYLTIHYGHVRPEAVETKSEEDSKSLPPKEIGEGGEGA